MNPLYEKLNKYYSALNIATTENDTTRAMKAIWRYTSVVKANDETEKIWDLCFCVDDTSIYAEEFEELNRVVAENIISKASAFCVDNNFPDREDRILSILNSIHPITASTKRASNLPPDLRTKQWQSLMDPILIVMPWIERAQLCFSDNSLNNDVYFENITKPIAIPEYTPSFSWGGYEINEYEGNTENLKIGGKYLKTSNNGVRARDKIAASLLIKAKGNIVFHGDILIEIGLSDSKENFTEVRRTISRLRKEGMKIENVPRIGYKCRPII
ncbi:MAG: hypothetical protein P1V18_00685 [Candidatus Gracilibacteria bacterium]|nr:hypothetical protein [Candidatus Gracilibacteria bacterium]